MLSDFAVKIKPHRLAIIVYALFSYYLLHNTVKAACQNYFLYYNFTFSINKHRTVIEITFNKKTENIV